MTSQEALAALGTKPQSLYASVSRGRVRTRPDPEDPRRRLYSREDIDRLAGRHRGQRRSDLVAAEAIRWGDPVLPSALTTVQDGRLFYRGYDAAALADRCTLEEVAALLWDCPVPAFPASEPTAPGEADPVARGFAGLARLAASEIASLRQPETELRAAAARVPGTLAVAFGASTTADPVHRRLASAWRHPEAASLLRQALVLLADHELNASTFAVRIAISTGASLGAAALAGLATLSGPLHGGAAATVADLATRVRSEGPAAVARAWAADGGVVAGFGHRLYPAGDPRAATLLSLFRPTSAFAELAAIGHDLTGEEPNIDYALAALCAAYSLPNHTPFLLFALARSVGWMAHALEQASTGTLIRPRAAYTGPPPESAAPR